MLKLIRATLASFLLLTILTGILYPLAITAASRALFANQSEGSLIDRNGQPTSDASAAVGSALIGQTFDQPKYFWPRPSATGPMPYNAASSSGSNLGPTNPALLDAVKSRIDALRAADPANKFPVPVDLITASGSGLDPHESVAAAQFQAARIASARGASVDGINTLIAANTTDSTLGLLGERVVNVLTLNLALDRQYPTPPATTTAQH